MNDNYLKEHLKDLVNDDIVSNIQKITKNIQYLNNSPYYGSTVEKLKHYTDELIRRYNIAIAPVEREPEEYEKVAQSLLDVVLLHRAKHVVTRLSKNIKNTHISFPPNASDDDIVLLELVRRIQLSRQPVEEKQARFIIYAGDDFIEEYHKTLESMR